MHLRSSPHPAHAGADVDAHALSSSARGNAHLAEIDSELRKRLSADSEERATDLENQDALEGIKNSEIQEIRQIQGALKRIAEGTYGVCVQCGAEIDPKRLKAPPVAAKCISCAA